MISVDNPFTVLSYVSGPALLTNASALLLLSTSNRFARAIDRSRILVARLDQAGAGAARAVAAEELKIGQRRIRLIAGAMTRFYSGVGMFTLATMVSVGGAVLAEYTGGAVFVAIIAFAVILGFAGFTALVLGAVSLMIESRLAVLSLEVEAREGLKAIDRALHPTGQVTAPERR